MPSPEYPIGPLDPSHEHHNRQTIGAYDADVTGYEANTHADPSEHHPARTWQNYALAVLNQRPEVKHLPALELGSGTGRDADYLESRGGISVRRTDAVSGFVKALRKKGYAADKLNALTDDLGGPYSMVFANGVFPHFSDAQAQHVMTKAYNSLASDGLLVVSFKITDAMRHWHLGTIEGWDIAIPPNGREVPPKIKKERYYYIRHPIEARKLILTGDRGRSAAFMGFNTERSLWLGAVVCKDGVGELPDGRPRRNMLLPPLPSPGGV